MPETNNDIERSETDAARRRYDRASKFYDWQVWPMELMGMRRFRRQVFARVSGPRVLEVGVGTGVNLPEYPAGLDVDAIDFSPGMLAHAYARANVHANVHLHEMDVEHLAFDETFTRTCTCTRWIFSTSRSTMPRLTPSRRRVCSVRSPIP